MEPWLAQLRAHVDKKPIVILRFSGDSWRSLLDSRRGASEFTVAVPHALVEQVRVPTVCLVAGNDGDDSALYFGLATSRAAVSTLDSRIKVRRAIRILPESISDLVDLIPEPSHRNSLRKRLDSLGPAIPLSPRLSSRLVEILASLGSNGNPIRTAVAPLFASRRFHGNVELQDDAVRTALAVFGVGSGDAAVSLSLTGGDRTALTRIPILEDAVIEHDARQVPGYKLVESAVTGRAVFERNGERLELFTANRRPLEKCFGVDLIYLNCTGRNLVMVQYKMLEPDPSEDGTDWIYRPDEKLNDEVRRMKKFSGGPPSGALEYRLNPSHFYLKFVKRDAQVSSGSIVIPLEHFEQLISDPRCRGPRGGLRVTFEALRGRYLRQTAFIDLIRSGYIGSHEETTKHLMSLVRAALANKRAVVAAIQSGS